MPIYILNPIRKLEWEEVENELDNYHPIIFIVSENMSIIKLLSIISIGVTYKVVLRSKKFTI